jgi:hypothetical protein
MLLMDAPSDMELAGSAWYSIANLNPLPPLPPDFGGEHLALRLRFYYNSEQADTDHSRAVGIENQSTSDVSTGFVRKPSAEVSISSSSDLQVQTGSSIMLTATVKGAVDKSVTWTITGSGCSGSACGKMKKDTYRAPKLLPNPPLVTLTAISNGEPAATSSVIVHLVSLSHH